jgi:peptide/nickel transport system substrate-binding protein
MAAAGSAAQSIDYKPDVLKALVPALSGDAKTVTIGYDSGQSDNQLVANLIAAQVSALGLTAKVQGYATSQIFGWISDPKGAPDALATLGWPDAAPAYTWAHISFDPGAGLNYLHCSDPAVTPLLAKGLVTGDAQTFAQAGTLASGTGCWLNLVDEQDFMVAQPWLKGVQESHVVTNPNTLNLATLSAG